MVVLLSDVGGTSDKITISGSIKCVSKVHEMQGFDFSVSMATQGREFSTAKREIVNKLLLSTLVELAKEEMQ